MGRGVKRSRTSANGDVQDGTPPRDGEGAGGSAEVHTHSSPTHTNPNGVPLPASSQASHKSPKGSSSSSPKRRKVASKSSGGANASTSATTTTVPNGKDETNGHNMADDVGAVAAADGDSSTAAGGGAAASESAALLSTVSPESALRRSPRLKRPDMKTPVRRTPKKMKNVKFAGKAHVTTFFFGSPPIHQSQPRPKFRSPAPSARKTPLKRFLVSPSPVRTRRSARRIASELADESKESNLATTSTSSHRNPIGSPPPSKRARHSFPSPVPPPPPQGSRPSSSSSSSGDVPPPPPPPVALSAAANGDAMDESVDEPPPPPPRSPPPSALSSNPAHQVPPSVVVGSTQDISLNLETPSVRSGAGMRRRSPRNRSRSLSPHSPRSPTIVSALLGSGRSRSPSLRRASISSTGSASSFTLASHVGDDALMSRRGSTTGSSGGGRRGSSKNTAPHKRRQVLSAIDIAAEAMHRQFDFKDVEDAREHLKRELQTVRKNSKLQLEKRGARIFSLEELERFVADTKNEVGVRTLIDRNEMNRLTTYSRSQLRKRLCEFYTEDSIQPLTKKYMMKLLKDKYEEDMEETQKLRDNYIFRELNCRDMSLEGTREERIQRLRDVMEIEVVTFEKEESELKREMDEVSAFTTREEIQKQVGLIRKEILKEQLKVLGLTFHERTGTPPYEVAQIYMFRLELYLAVIEKAQLRSAELNPHSMTTEELETEMKKRRLHIPDSFGERSDTEEWHDRVSRLNLALIEDKKKGPVKYDWGSAWFDRDDLTALTKEQMISELESLDALTPLASAMTDEQLREHLAESLIERSNKAVEDTLRTELKPFGKDKIRGDKGRLFKCLERVYWEHLAREKFGGSPSPHASSHSPPSPWTPSPQKQIEVKENAGLFQMVARSVLSTFNALTT